MAEGGGVATNVNQITKLNSTNYRTWKFEIELILRERSLWELVMKRESPPDSTATQEEKLKYQLRESRAYSTIALSISPTLRSMFSSIRISHVLWEAVQQSFEPISRARIGALLTEFYAIKFQEGELIPDFLSRLYHVNMQLEEAGYIIKDADLAYKMIGTLPPSYDALVSNIYQLDDTEFKPEAIKKKLLTEYGRQVQREALNEVPTNAYAVHHVKKTVSNTNDKNTNQSKFRGKCFNCGRMGHRSNVCRQEKKTKNQDQTRKTEKGAFYASALCTTTTATKDWIVDSGATRHFCNQREWFYTFTKYQSQATVGEGKSRVEGRGNIWLQMNDERRNMFLLQDVIYTPGMGRNLISERLLDQAGYEGRRKDSKYIAYFPHGGYAFEAPLSEENFYRVDAKVLINGPEEDSKEEDNAKPQAYAIETKGLSNIQTWHLRLGHLNENDLKYMSHHEMLYGLRPLNQKLDTCIPCKVSKSTRQPFKTLGEIRSKNILDLIHSDVWGPSSVASIGGARYFITFIDDKSRLIHIYTMKKKSEAFDCFRRYKAQVEKETGKQIKSLRTDNGLEYCSTEFIKYCQQEGITLERTNVYSPQMNGIAERTNRTLLNTVRALMEDAKLPKTLWGELVHTAAYIKNRVRHSQLEKVPVEYWMGRKPSANYLKRIGCLAFAHIPQQRRRNKLQNRAKLGVLVGYANRTKGYRIWYPRERKVSETKHVSFDERRLGVEKTNMPQEDEEIMNWPIEENNEEVQYTEETIIIKPKAPLRTDSPIKTVTVNTEVKEEPVMETVEQGEVPDEKPIYDISDLPDGWRRHVTIRKKGQTKGMADIYYYDPQGTEWRSKKSLTEHIKQNNLPLDPDIFDFSRKNLATSLLTSITQEDIDDVFHAYCADVVIPKNYNEAIQSPQRKEWQSAMDEEVETFQQRKVAQIIRKPSDRKIVGCRWVYAVKKNSEGKIIRYRARLVAQGFSQNEGEDYDRSFSPVVHFSLIRLFLAIFVITFGWVHEHLDVKNAYLYGELDREVLMNQIPGYETNEPKNFCLKLFKALYGLPQSGRQWFLELDRSFNELGFNKLIGTNCIYYIPNTAIVLVYVDDLIVLAKNEEIRDQVYSLLSTKYDVKRLGPIKKLLGVEFHFKPNGILKMTQTTYIKQLTEKFGIYSEEAVSLPIPAGIILSRRDCPENDEEKKKNGKDTISRTNRITSIYSTKDPARHSFLSYRAFPV